MAPGTELDLLVGLGNGFDTAPAGARPLLVGGGVGASPLYGLAQQLVFRDTGIGRFSSRHHDLRGQPLQKFLRGYGSAEYQLLTLGIIAEPFDFVFRQNRDR